ncbi:hypothetical protein DYB31_015513 [Aphanomyces astaci]|uniref:Uncharacterized protein n=1 Tax=Aphanomyces astaci TaxID=112090 RepID=A0A397EL12_APHAT|nr:hypothetical protein DYB31_015513 [Aphanomyces astaci]
MSIDPYKTQLKVYKCPSVNDQDMTFPVKMAVTTATGLFQGTAAATVAENGPFTDVVAAAIPVTGPFACTVAAVRDRTIVEVS